MTKLEAHLAVAIQVKEPQNAGVPQNAAFASNCRKLLSRIPNFEKNRFFEEVLQRALFKTLVITIVFKS